MPQTTQKWEATEGTRPSTCPAVGPALSASCPDRGPNWRLRTVRVGVAGTARGRPEVARELHRKRVVIADWGQVTVVVDLQDRGAGQVFVNDHCPQHVRKLVDTSGPG